MAQARNADKQDLFVDVKGKGKSKFLSAGDLLQLQELWGTLEPGYARFQQRFARMNRHRPRDARLRTLREWRSSRQDVFSPAEEKWQLMDAEIMVCNLLLPRFLSLRTHTHTHTDDDL
jgi:hypothetical protein